ncbi:phosphopantetheine-binding protein [Micromonospora sp. 4G55]|uniref:phosphopantetheine-binding protein n=1 Tax=Micromonospora sp. 4G55 TaxID=2806102 RepID=UPI001A4EB141|nr:phosphopantetheine-binding protein [Micromonospora sp. 4G55]MBM0259386.1 hypothetical protein [Micromonospora sp. 4G55]
MPAPDRARDVPRQRPAPERPATPAPPVAPPTDPARWDTARLDRLVVDVWRDVLGVERVGMRDNFFDLGGHSMRLLAVLDRLRPNSATSSRSPTCSATPRSNPWRRS